MRRVLVVEDEQVLRETYQLILSTQPYICDVAENGKIALEMIKNNSYDLILLDVMMPEMGGVELLEKLDSIDDMKQKIIIMSNLSSGKDMDRIKAFGIQKNVVKSDVSPRQLISLVRLHLNF